MIDPLESAGNPVRVNLDPAAENLLNNIRASGFPGWSSLPLDHARAAILQMRSLAGEPESVARVEDLCIPGSDSAEILARLYIPESRVPTPVMVYMHGGGWVLGDYTGVDVLVRRLANRSECAILSVNYRLAPEHKYPSALDDVDSVLKWVKANAMQWALDADRLAVGGDSSGANLAAAASLVFVALSENS
jgi:acetyl esterase